MTLTASALEADLARQIHYAGLPEPVYEHRFAPPRRFRFDMCYPPLMLGIEVEGATWAHGRHTRGAGYEKDTEKYNLAVLLGWRVLRFTGDMVKDGRALATIEQALRHAKEDKEAQPTTLAGLEGFPRFQRDEDIQEAQNQP